MKNKQNTLDTLRIAGLTKESVCDGPGIRFVVFVQGCFHNCLGCHNPQTHDPDGGVEISIDELLKMIDSNPLLDGVTFSGGEPFLQAGALTKLAEHCRRRGLSIMTYSGYHYEEILENTVWRELLSQTNILVEGPFILEKATHEIPFCGSSNQRIFRRDLQD